MPGTEDETQLLELLAKDSEYAFAVIFDRYKQKIYNATFSFLKQSDAAEEVVQEVFLKLWQNRKQLPDIAYLNSFLRKMAYHLVVDQLRRSSLEKGYTMTLRREQPVIDDTDHRLREGESLKILELAISQLPPRQRQVYEMARIQGLSQEEIAASLAISKNTVKVHMSAALQSIRDYLSTTYPDNMFTCLVLLLAAAILEK